MTKSRIIQLILLIALFVGGVVFFNSGSSSTGDNSTNGEGYIPASP